MSLPSCIKYRQGSASFQFARFARPQVGNSRYARAYSRLAFTLLEVLLAVMIVAMLSTTLYHFLEANLNALRTSEDANADRLAMDGLINLLQTQLADLPAKGQGVLMGEPHKFSGLSADTMQWLCSPGQGLLTTAASGNYRVTFELQPVNRSKTSAIYELVLSRRPVDGTEKDMTQILLMRPAASLEIRYFHPQLNAPIERWNDQNTRPSFVRVAIRRNADEPPYEAVLSVPTANLQQ